MLDTEGLSITSKQRAIYPSGRRKGKKKQCFLPVTWDVFDRFGVMCLAFSMVSQFTASCFLASASSPYTRGTARLASARKQDLD